MFCIAIVVVGFLLDVMLVIEYVIALLGFTVYHGFLIPVVGIAVDLHVAGMFLVVIVLLIVFCCLCFPVCVKVVTLFSCCFGACC